MASDEKNYEEEDEEYYVSVGQVMDVVIKARDKCKPDSKDYENGYRDACALIMEHYLCAIQDIKDSNDATLH